MKYNIRKQEREDCFDVHHVVVISWNETYKGIVKDDILKEMIVNEKNIAEKIYNEFDKREYKSLVLEVDNEIVGFANYGKSSENIENCGEIFAIYILKKFQGKGLGKKLIEKCITELKKLNLDRMIISCLKENPSNEFYKHIGGKIIQERTYDKLNLPENIYIFDI